MGEGEAAASDVSIQHQNISEHKITHSGSCQRFIQSTTPLPGAQTGALKRAVRKLSFPGLVSQPGTSCQRGAVFWLNNPDFFAVTIPMLPLRAHDAFSTQSKVFQSKVHTGTSPLPSFQHITYWFHLLLLTALSAALAASSPP